MKSWIAKLCLLTFAVSVLFGGYSLVVPNEPRAEAAVSKELRGMWIAMAIELCVRGLLMLFRQLTTKYYEKYKKEPV